MPKIAFATCSTIPEPDPDEAPLLAACVDAGLSAEMAGWDDPSVDWSRFDLVVPRSTWNYYEHEAAFRLWVAHIAQVSKIRNSADLILRTIDKRYLLSLETQGIPIVPTRLITSARDLPEMIGGLDWEEFVIKPTVSAASYLTRRFERTDMEEAVRFLREVLKGRLAMVQQYMRSVESDGEVNLAHIDGQLTHGVVKYPRYHGGVESVADEVCEITPAHREMAAKVMETVTEPWLYARVDLMETPTGDWVLSELEVIEPSLFFVQHPPALNRFVAALAP